MQKIFTSLLIVLLLSFSPVFAEVLAPCAPPNLTAVKQEVRDYYDSGRWSSDMEEIAARAREHLEGFDPAGRKLALVFDIDETVLTSYAFLKGIDFAFNLKMPQWVEWIEEGNPPAVPATKKLYDYAREKGFYLFFITGRPEQRRPAAERNLEKAGFAGYEGLIMRTAAYKGKSNRFYKEQERKKITDAGYTIILNIGDQESDLHGGYSGTKFKLPNPMYCDETKK